MHLALSTINNYNNVNKLKWNYDQPKKCIMLCHTIDFWNISSKITLINITDK